MRSRQQGRAGEIVRRMAGLLPLVGLAFLLTGHEAAALRLPDEEEGVRVRVYAMWNKQYLSLAARVPDTMLTGTSTAPMSTPEQDDAVEFAFEVEGEELQAHRLIISAAGGMTLLTRDARGQWRTDNSWIAGPRTVKYAVATAGEINDLGERDTQYVVECAIPWEFLGGEAPANSDIGFNVVVWMQGDNEGLASWSPSVREPAHAGDAARWGRMFLRLGSGLAKATGGYVPCPYIGRVPFIDGTLAADEWLTATTLEFDKPKPVVVPSPDLGKRTGLAGLVLAIYRYDWQGGRDATGGAPLWRQDGTPATAHQPLGGAGPWVSYNRVAWQAQELGEAQRAGIDVLLVRYSGREEARRTWALTGLDRLVQALKKRRAEGRGYPLLGLMLEPDASQPQVYEMVRDFFLHVPGEFWAEIGGRPEEGVVGGVPVYLGSPAGLSGWGADSLRECEGLVSQEFGGRVVWLGGREWREAGADLYAYVDLPTETGFAMSSQEGARVATISPGHCPPPGATGLIRPRMEGKSYRADWQRALASRPELVIINSWNDYGNGTEIAPSRQHGVFYVDTTRFFQSLMGSREEYALLLKQRRVPRVLAAGVGYQAELLLENVGTKDIRTGVKVAVDQTIRRRADGEVVWRRSGAQGLTILAGQTKRVPVLIPTKDQQGKPLPPGEYLVGLNVVRSKLAYLRSPWLTKTLAELIVPITVGEAPTRKATVISTSLPATIASGGTKHVVVRLRNDGTSEWTPGEVKVSYHWIKHGRTRPSWGGEAMIVGTGDRVELPQSVAPGETVSVVAPVAAVDSQGEPLPPSSPGGAENYRVAWALAWGESSWVSDEGLLTNEEAIRVVAHGGEAVFESAGSPATLAAGEGASIDLVVANAGTRTWRVGHDGVLPRWYRWDGRPLDVEAQQAELTADIAPGERSLVTAAITAPDVAGPYWLAWGMVAGEQGQRASAVAPVFVRPWSLTPVDLTDLLNVAAATSDSYRGRGGLDGRGNSLPAEWLPPDHTGPMEPLYPSGYYAPEGQGTPGREASVPFSFPEVTSGVAGAVACVGQQVPFGGRGARAIHLAVTSTEGPQMGSFGLAYPDGETEPAPILVGGWNQWDGVARLAAYTPYVRTLSADEAAEQAYIYHVTLLPTKGEPEALELPKAPWIKVFAITVETTPGD